jgi:hypothetical protein
MPKRSKAPLTAQDMVKLAQEGNTAEARALFKALVDKAKRPRCRSDRRGWIASLLSRAEARHARSSRRLEADKEGDEKVEKLG